jgi:putative ABC transport system permease protein
MSSWRAVLRIARRDALRSRGRSALVVAMIALPVLGVTAVDVVARTFELSPEQYAERHMGRADAAFSDTGLTAVEQQGGGYGSEAAARPEGEPFDLASVLPPGSRSVSDTARDGAVSAAGVTTRAQLRELSYDDPVAVGMYEQVEGRAPERAGEIAMTTALAARLGIGVGEQVTLERGDRPHTLVGLVADASYRDARTVLLEPDALPGGSAFSSRLLVDLPGELQWSHVQAANAEGVHVEPRHQPIPGAPPEPDYGEESGEAIAVVALVVGMALLEVVLLAGPAFAVGAKRSSRQLALLAATGAERRDVRRTVLGGGLVLGSAGALIGVAGGIGLAAAAVPALGRFDTAIPGPFDVRPAEVAAIALLGVVTALLAAWLPARAAARQDVVAALTGRRGTVRSSRRLPVLGLLLAVVGALIALQGARSREVLLILLGSALAELGLVAATPALVGLSGRLGPLLPVAPRLALRDAARNRGRTAPAVSAILAAVAGSVAVGTFVASQDARDREGYTPSAAHGSAVVSLYGDVVERADEVVAVLERELPAAEVVVASAIGGPWDGAVDTGYVELVAPVQTRSCFYDGAPGAAPRPCGNGSTSGMLSAMLPGLLIGDGALVRAMTGADDPALGRALAQGSAVVPADRLGADGTVTLVVHPPGDTTGTEGREVTLPGVALPADAYPVAVLPASVAERAGQRPVPVGVAVRTEGMPSEQQQDRATGALESLGLEASLYVERGYTSDYGAGLIALAVGSALLVLGASSIATGLAAADGRADLSTLAAVGATPGLRRRLAGAQSLVTAALGTTLGIVAGLVPAIGLIRALNAPSGGLTQLHPWPLVLPWPNLLVTAIVVPLLAALAAVLLTRSRLPLVRRLA